MINEINENFSLIICQKNLFGAVAVISEWLKGNFRVMANTFVSL